MRGTVKLKNRGITLITLAITIVVLLILSGVTIETLTGDNGILSKTNEAKIATELTGIKEELELLQIQNYETKETVTNSYLKRKNVRKKY